MADDWLEYGHRWTITATGVAPVQEVIAHYDGHPTDAMQYGTLTVMAWQLNGAHS